MKIEVSIGEAIDKLSILELKRRFIQDAAKLAEIEKEIAILEAECNQYKNHYYNILNYVNEKIWHLTNEIKRDGASADVATFARISNEIFEFNQKRFRIKNIFNLAQNSAIKEQKSYSNKNARIVINTPSQIYDKIAEITALTIEYDFLFFDGAGASVADILKKTHPIAFETGIIIVGSPTSDVGGEIVTIDLSTQEIATQEIAAIFEPPTISYRTCGLFGDFIHQLSVVNEKFLETGRKGVVYLFECGFPFRNGLEATYNDTYDVISKQPYIKSYKIYNGEPFDVCLTAWRNNLSHDSWNDIFKRTYGVNWGAHPWIAASAAAKWKNKVLINNPKYRPIISMTAADAEALQEYATETGTKLVFLSYSEDDFHEFKNHFSNLTMEYYRPTLFADMCTAIRSCKFYIGGMSGALTLAHAMQVPRVVLLYGEPSADTHEQKMAPMWPNVFFNVKDIITRMRAECISELHSKIAELEKTVADLSYQTLPRITSEKSRVYGCSSAPDFVFTTMHNDGFRELADLTMANKIAYCKRHKYPLVAKTENWHHIAIGFEKAYVIREAFELYPNCKWIFFSECDTYITNPAISLDQIIEPDETRHFIITTDFNGINAGSFFVRNSELGRAFIDEMIENIPMFEHEQAFIANRDAGGTYSHIIAKYNQTLFNSYLDCRYGMTCDKFGNLAAWRPGHFIVHWAGFNYEERIGHARAAAAAADT